MPIKDFTKRSAAALVVIAVAAFATPLQANTVIEWNRLAGQLVTGAPFAQARWHAMVHVAMADAVVAVEGRYEPFKFDLGGARGGSPNAAAAQAARDVLAAFALTLPPADQSAALAAINTKLAADLAALPPGLANLGKATGKKSAAMILAWRATDGFAAANPASPILPSTLPGIWRPTASGEATFSKLGEVEPFATLSSTQFLPRPPPQLESPLYAADFNEVKTLGERPSSPYATCNAAPAATHRIALVWANAAPCGGVTTIFRLWQGVARDMAVAKQLSLVQTARLFALLTAAQFDSVQTSQNSKFVYRLWRPETAIANAGTVGADPDYDDNPATADKPGGGWAPVLLTPPYPSYSGNMQCTGAGATGILRALFGDANNFTAKWYLTNAPSSPVVREQSYTTFTALEVEQGMSRVYGGIHFNFDNVASIESCEAVADYIYATKMRPL